MIDDQADTFELKEYVAQLESLGYGIGPEIPELYQGGLTVQNVFNDVDIFTKYLDDITEDNQVAIDELQSIKAIVIDINMPPGKNLFQKDPTITSMDTGKILAKYFYKLFYENERNYRPLFFTLSNFAGLDNIGPMVITHLSKLASVGSRTPAYITNCRTIDDMIK